MPLQEGTIVCKVMRHRVTLMVGDTQVLVEAGRYVKLTPSQVEAWRDRVQPLAEGEEPPDGAEIISPMPVARQAFSAMEQVELQRAVERHSGRS